MFVQLCSFSIHFITQMMDPVILNIPEYGQVDLHPIDNDRESGDGDDLE